MNQLSSRGALVATPDAVDLSEFEVRGNPTDDEALAAITALLAVLTTPVPDTRSRWRSRPNPAPPVLSRTPGAWRASGWP